jgi:hypothetical protein
MRSQLACSGFGVSLVIFALGCGGSDSPTGGGSASTGTAGSGGTHAGTGGSGGVAAGGGGNSGSSTSSGPSTVGSGGSNDAGPGPTQDCPFTKDMDGFFTLTSPLSDYVARLPANYDVANPEPTRLIVALHGCEDTAYNHATWAGVPYNLRDSQDYISISLGGRDGGCWKVPDDKAIIDAAVAHVRSCFYVHQKKIVLAGFSSGGDLTYVTSMHYAKTYAGILIEHSDLTDNVGAGNVDSVIAGAAWKFNVSIRAGDNDMVYPIATVKSDYQKMLAAGFPIKITETADTHDGTSTDWEALIPQSSTWLAP